MKISNEPVQPHNTIGQKLAAPFKKAASAVKKGYDAVDRYTSPREETGGDFEKASYFQACFTGSTEGLCVMGVPGIFVGAGSAAMGVAVTNKTGSQAAGVAAGIATGAATGAAIGAVVGGPMGIAGGAIAGGILGAMETFRGNPSSATRDAAGNANMISAPFVPGPAKMAGGIGSAVGSKMESKMAKSVVGGTVAAAVGGTLAAIGFAPVSIPVAIVSCAAAGVLGPHLGPRYSQFFRNLSNDIGKGLTKVGQKLGIVSKDSDGGKAKNVIGAIPSSFIKEGIRGFALSDGSISKMLIAGVMESVEQAHIFLKSKVGKSDKIEESMQKISTAEVNKDNKAEDKKEIK